MQAWHASQARVTSRPKSLDGRFYQCSSTLNLFSPRLVLPDHLRASPTMSRMPDSVVENYAQRTTCFDFAYGQCIVMGCIFSHSILDVSRLLKLVGDVSSDTSHQVFSNPVYLALSYATERHTSATALEARHGCGGRWTLRLMRRAPTASIGSTSTSLLTPVESTNANAVDSLKTVEAEILGSVRSVSSLGSQQISIA